MGWLFSQGQTRSGLIHHLTQSEESDTHKRVCLKYSARGNVLWGVWEVTDKQTGNIHKFISCDLMQKERNYGWGYKDMSESMGPCYYTCPLRYLKEVPLPDSEFAGPWREKVKAYHARQKRVYQVGQKVAILYCKIPEAIIESNRPLLGRHEGVLYRLNRNLIA